jgi:hypothetical protein
MDPFESRKKSFRGFARVSLLTEFKMRHAPQDRIIRRDIAEDVVKAAEGAGSPCALKSVLLADHPKRAPPPLVGFRPQQSSSRRDLRQPQGSARRRAVASDIPPGT